MGLKLLLFQHHIFMWYKCSEHALHHIPSPQRHPHPHPNHLLAAQTLYNAMLENNCSEHASRMSAMENSTKSAGEMLQSLTLKYVVWLRGQGLGCGVRFLMRGRGCSGQGAGSWCSVQSVCRTHEKEQVHTAPFGC